MDHVLNVKVIGRGGLYMNLGLPPYSALLVSNHYTKIDSNDIWKQLFNEFKKVGALVVRALIGVFDEVSVTLMLGILEDSGLMRVLYRTEVLFAEGKVKKLRSVSDSREWSEHVDMFAQGVVSTYSFFLDQLERAVRELTDRTDPTIT